MPRRSRSSSTGLPSVIPSSRHIVRTRTRYRFSWLVLDRGVSLRHQPVRPTLALWLKPSFDGLCFGGRKCGTLRRAFNDFWRLTGSLREHGLDGLDGLLDLLVGHRLNPLALLDFQLARHQQRKYFEVRGRLGTSDLLDRLLALMAEVQQQRLHELLIEEVTRAVSVAMRVA